MFHVLTLNQKITEVQTELSTNHWRMIRLYKFSAKLKKQPIQILKLWLSFMPFVSTGMAVILYESRLGCLENEIPKETQDYISVLHLMFSSFKTTMYAGAIPKWLRTIIPKPWQEFCFSWDGMFKFSKWSTPCHVWHEFAYVLVYITLKGYCSSFVLHLRNIWRDARDRWQKKSELRRLC